jgi:predicted transcriptional regulator
VDWGDRMKEKGSVIDGTFGRLFNSATGRMLDVLILHRGYDLSLTDLAKYAGVTPKTVWKELSKLESIGLIKHTRKVGNAKMVTLNQDVNPLAAKFIEIEFGSAFKDMKRQSE